MDVERRIARAKRLTPTEQTIAGRVLELGDGLDAYTLKEFSALAGASVPSVHRFCRKIGLEGYKELKVEVARSAGARATPANVDVNFPFPAGASSERVATRMEEVYRATLHGTHMLLDDSQMEHAADLAAKAAAVDVYAQSHNLAPAQTFADRLLSIGICATCHDDFERKTRCALASDASHVAVAISYSGRAPHLLTVLPLLKSTGTPVVLVGTPAAAHLHPGLACYLELADQESLSERITQFSSHLAVQFMLDVLYGSVVARTYDRSLAFQRNAYRYTALPGTRRQPNIA